MQTTERQSKPVSDDKRTKKPAITTRGQHHVV